MSNYKTITDTGPYAFSPHLLLTQQDWLHKPTASPGDYRNNKPPGSSPPPTPDKQSPPSFFEKGSPPRWLLLLLPFVHNRYFYNEISPFDLADNQFCKFYLVYFICSLFSTHFALNAKRRALSNLLHDEDDHPYRLHTIETSYNSWTNTTITPLLCIALGLAKVTQQIICHHNALLPALATIATAAVFAAIYRANNYSYSYNAIYQIEPPQHPNNLSTQSRNLLIRTGTLGLTFLWYYDNLIEWGMLDPDIDTKEQHFQ